MVSREHVIVVLVNPGVYAIQVGALAPAAHPGKTTSREDTFEEERNNSKEERALARGSNSKTC